jgi:cytochrome oxidase Cu insertion factor (SCO1/SenC/PrrC family)
MKNNRRGHWTLAALLLVFIAPMLLAWYLYTHPGLLKGHSNQGQLLHPPLQLKAMQFDEITHNMPSLKGKWTLFYVSALPCQKQCEQVIYKIRQIRTATGKERHRVNRLVLFVGDKKTLQLEQKHLLSYSQGEYAGTLLTSISNIEFARQPATALQQNTLYLIDPLGNIMLSYPADVAPKALFKDLKHLMQISQIG